MHSNIRLRHIRHRRPASAGFLGGLGSAGVGAGRRGVSTDTPAAVPSRRLRLGHPTVEVLQGTIRGLWGHRRRGRSRRRRARRRYGTGRAVVIVVAGAPGRRRWGPLALGCPLLDQPGGRAPLLVLAVAVDVAPPPFVGLVDGGVGVARPPQDGRRVRYHERVPGRPLDRDVPGPFEPYDPPSLGLE